MEFLATAFERFAGEMGEVEEGLEQRLRHRGYCMDCGHDVGHDPKCCVMVMAKALRLARRRIREYAEGRIQLEGATR